jgi:hypothetical protein
VEGDIADYSFGDKLPFTRLAFSSTAFERWREARPAQCGSQGCAFYDEEISEGMSAPPKGGTGLDACKCCGE